jgi:glycosidase
MPWTNVPGAGFTDPHQQPWLPFGPLACNVADQQNRPDSVLPFCRRLIALRREHPDLAFGPYHAEDGPPGIWRFRRGDTLVIVANISPKAQTVEANGEAIVSTVPLARTWIRWQFPPWSGALLRS